MVHHAAGLFEETKNEELVEAIKSDWRKAPIDEQERAMLTYAEKLTLDIKSMEEGDVIRLREAGFDDREIHDIALVTSYFNFVNRMADGLGVGLEDTPPRQGSREYRPRR